MKESKKSFKEAKEAHLKLEQQLQAAQQLLDSPSKEKVKPKKQKPEQKTIKALDPMILKLIKESYNQRLDQLLTMQGSLQTSFYQHPIVLEYQRKDQVEKKYLELLASYERSRDQLNHFHLEAKKSYLEWLKLISEDSDV